MRAPDPLDRLLASEDPCARYRARLRLLGEPPGSRSMRSLADQVRRSPRVRALLAGRDERGRIPGDPYAKYTGAHWTLAILAEIDYPPGDPDLIPLREQVFARWLDPRHTAEQVVEKQALRYKSRPGVPVIQGRARRCASQEGNALWSTLKLGIADSRLDQLRDNLVRWQWQDGGWNCDLRAEATHSSFHESLIPLRALALHAQTRDDPVSGQAARRAGEVFLKRRLYKRQRDGEIMHPAFLKLHFPHYWHYDVLFGLTVMAECGLARDPRCAEALDHLESLRLPDGGFPAQRKHYRAVEKPAPGGSRVDWGGTSAKRMNEWVTLEALIALQAAGRLPV